MSRRRITLAQLVAAMLAKRPAGRPLRASEVLARAFGDGPHDARQTTAVLAAMRSIERASVVRTADGDVAIRKAGRAQLCTCGPHAWRDGPDCARCGRELPAQETQR